MRKEIALALAVFAFSIAPAYAQLSACGPKSCQAVTSALGPISAEGEKIIKDHAADEFSKQREWQTNEFFKNKFLPALKKYSKQLVVMGKQQMQIAGSLMDADEQMETQRLFQTMQAEAHKNFQPSEDLCYFGTNVRSMASSEQRSRANAAALSGQSLSRQMGTSGTPGATSLDADKEARWRQFSSTYCDPATNNPGGNGAQGGMGPACGAGARDKERMNRDIDFGRLIDAPLTLDVNFEDSDKPADEEDVQAFIDNIFPALSRQPGSAGDRGQRAIAARRGVAQNSINSIIGLKSAGTSDEGRTREFLAATMKQLGMPDDEIYPLIGDKPSYYAQLEILAKRIYQSPGFFRQLYDKPANVERKAAALRAIDSIIDRALYESEMRQETMLSAWLATKLDGEFQRANTGAGK